MHITDVVYGEVEIQEPVLCALLETDALQRLKGVDQAGYFEPYVPGSAHTRYEHSVGVCVLLGKYGASLDEQIAGLIHDVSHTAFSHCIDYVLAKGSETAQAHQDEMFDVFVRQSDIPRVLASYGHDIERIFDDTNFPLLERDLPDLCADRIDYSLRSARMYGEIDDAFLILNGLTVQEGFWVFSDYKSARTFAELFRTVNTNYYAGRASARMFRTLADYLEHALQRGYITEALLYATDRAVLEVIEGFHEKDAHLRELFEKLNNPAIPIAQEGAPVSVCCKSRIVDPLYMEGDRLRRISDADPTWQKVLEEEMKPKCHLLQ